MGNFNLTKIKPMKVFLLLLVLAIAVSKVESVKYKGHCNLIKWCDRYLHCHHHVCTYQQDVLQMNQEQEMGAESGFSNEAYIGAFVVGVAIGVGVMKFKTKGE